MGFCGVQVRNEIWEWVGWVGGRGPRFVPASGFHFICEETGVPCSTGAAGGVCIYFGGRLLRANRTRKISNGDVRAFASPNFPPLGELSASRCLLFFENGIRICCSDSHISDPMVWDIMRKKFRNKTRCCKYRSCQTTTTGFAPPSPNEKSMSDGKFTLWNYRHKCGSGCSLVLGDIDPQHKKSCSRGDRHR